MSARDDGNSPVCSDDRCDVNVDANLEDAQACRIANDVYSIMGLEGYITDRGRE